MTINDKKLEDGNGGKSGCAACFAKQAQKQQTALKNGEEPKPLCAVAARMQAMLDGSLANHSPLPLQSDAPTDSGNDGPQ